MKAKAKEVGMADGNCLGCHGANIPAALNHRGEWLVTEKDKRKSRGWDMAWLKDYKEPTPAPAKAAPARKP
jgi:mono/diheme cytochrome c family protein